MVFNALFLRVAAKVDALRERQRVAVVDRARRTTHVLLPRVAAGLATAARLLRTQTTNDETHNR